jgi:hypothetical protein
MKTLGFSWLVGWMTGCYFCLGMNINKKHFDSIEVNGKDTVTHSFHLVGLRELTNMVSEYPVFDTRYEVGMPHIIPKSYC